MTSKSGSFLSVWLWLSLCKHFYRNFRLFLKPFLAVFVCILIDRQFNNYNSLFFTPTSRFSHWPSLYSSRLNVTKTLNYVIISSSLILGRHFPGDIHSICSPESHFELSSLQIYNNNNNNFPSLLFPSGIIVGTAVAKTAWSFPFSSVLLITTRVKSSFYSVIKSKIEVKKKLRQTCVVRTRFIGNQLEHIWFHYSLSVTLCIQHYIHDHTLKHTHLFPV